MWQFLKYRYIEAKSTKSLKKDHILALKMTVLKKIGPRAHLD
jgi:hypothetical protein